jgi:hypothetical protein
MPASEIMSDFKKGTLHSGGSGKIVTNPHQAKAIQLSYLRKEGHEIPMKRNSMYRKVHNDRKIEHRMMGGPVQSGQPYMVGEQGPEMFKPPVSGSIVPNRLTESNPRRAMPGVE